jgi:AhpD family alkylhydroperoxidase
MENLDKEKIEQIIKTRKQAHTFYSKKSEQIAKELITIGISIVINCELCVKWCIKQALDDGASEKEILEAVEVGI